MRVRAGTFDDANPSISGNLRTGPLRPVHTVRVSDHPQGVTDSPVTVVVVDDHRMFGELLRRVISTDPGMACVGTADNLSDGFSMIDALRPDAVIMDVQVGSEDGIGATAELVRKYPGLRVVVLTAFSTEPLLRRAVSAGASALLAKDGAVEDLLAALKPAGPDEFNVDPALLRRLLTTRREKGGRAVMLTTREDQVLHLLAEGLDTTAIAARLGISRNTCRGYVGALFGKLDAHSQLEAVAVAKRKGLLRESS